MCLLCCCVSPTFFLLPNEIPEGQASALCHAALQGENATWIAGEGDLLCVLIRKVSAAKPRCCLIRSEGTPDMGCQKIHFCMSGGGQAAGPPVPAVVGQGRGSVQQRDNGKGPGWALLANLFIKKPPFNKAGYYFGLNPRPDNFITCVKYTIISQLHILIYSAEC